MTTYPADLVSTEFVFGLSDGTTVVESAEFTLWGQCIGPAIPTDWDAALAQLAEAMYGSWVDNAVSTMWGGFTTLESVKCATYGTDGKTTFEQEFIADTLWVGTGGSTVMPWQISLCVGIYSYTPGTFIAHAGRRRGRVYLPPMEASLLSSAPDGNMSSATAIAGLDLVNHLFATMEGTDLDTSPGPAAAIGGVFSRLDQRLWQVTDFKDDVKWDTQRRRAKSLPAASHQREFDATP